MLKQKKMPKIDICILKMSWEYELIYAKWQIHCSAIQDGTVRRKIPHRAEATISSTDRQFSLAEWWNYIIFMEAETSPCCLISPTYGFDIFKLLTYSCIHLLIFRQGLTM